MTRVATVAVLLLVLTLSAGICAEQEQVLLRYKLQPGQVWLSSERTKTQLQIQTRLSSPTPSAPDAMLTDVATDARTNSSISIKSVDEAGDAHASVRIDYMLLDTMARAGQANSSTILEMENGKVSITGDGAAHVPAETLQAMEQVLGGELLGTWFATSGLKLDESQRQAFCEATGEGDVQWDLREILRTCLALPTSPVGVGETWENEYASENEQRSGQGSLVIQKLEAVDGRRVATISATGSILITDIGGEGGQGLSLGAGMGDMEVKDGWLELTIEATYEMDLEVGQITRTTQRMVMSCQQTMIIKQPTPGTEDQTTDVEVTVQIDDGQVETTSTLELAPQEQATAP